jgi:hypothetical protein
METVETDNNETNISAPVNFKCEIINLTDEELKEVFSNVKFFSPNHNYSNDI